MRGLAARPALFLAGAWVIGILLGDRWPLPARVWLMAAVIGVGAGATLWVLAYRPGSARRLLPASLVAALLALAAAGAARTRLVLTPPPGDVSAWIGRQVGITGTICREPAVDAKRRRFLLAVEQVRASGQLYPAQGRLYVFAPLDPPVGLGERVEVFGVPERPLPATNPGGFSAADWLRREGCFALLRARPRGVVSRGNGRLPWWQRWPVRLRQALTTANGRALEATMIRHGVPEAAQATRIALIHAIAVGSPDAPDADWPTLVQRFRDAGIIHLLVASGAQVWMILGVLMLLGRWLGLKAGALLALIGIWAYAGIAGLEPPIVRAAIMGSAYLIGWLLGREAIDENSLGLSAFLLLLEGPLTIHHIGFQLSFLAVWGLMRLATPLEEALQPWLPGWGGPERRPRHWVRGLRQLQCDSLTLVTAAIAAPLFCTGAIAHFVDRLFLVSFASNLLAVPLASLILPVSLPVALLNLTWEGMGLAVPLPEPWSWGNELLLTLAGALDATAAYFAARGWAWVNVFPPGWVPVMLSVAGLVLVGVALRPHEERRRRKGPTREQRTLAAAVGLLLQTPLMAAMFVPARPPATPEWTFIDVGQGDCYLARFPDGGTMLVDGGGTPFSDVDIGERIVAPTLRALRVPRLDLVVLSHAHEDHVGGLPAVLREFRVGRVLDVAGPVDAKSYPLFRELVRRHRIPYTVARRGMRIELGPRRGAVLEVLHPPEGLLAETGSDVNNNSIVLRVTAGGVRYLLAGDAEAAAEASMRGIDLAAEVLKVGHHGSATSTGEAWLRAVRPRLAVISCGRHNPFGHPRAETVRRLERHGVTLFRTDRDGAVVVVGDGKTLKARGTVPTTAR